MQKVLLVEDDNNLREIYEARLQAEGYQIVSAKDGEEALAVAKAEKPDLIISDVMMPKISGFEMLDIIRNTDGLKHVKIIMLTALGQSDDQQRASSLGADRYLIKSQVTLEDIVRVAHELLGEADGLTNASNLSSPSSFSANNNVADMPVNSSVESPQNPQVKLDENNINPQSLSQEKANMEANIEDFVAGATSQPPGPQSEVSPQSVQLDNTSTTNADDQLMNEAINSLMTDSDQLTPTVQPTDQTPTIKDTPQVMARDDSTIAHKKVIAPLEDKPKPDIQKLYAQESASEDSAPNPVAEPPTDHTDNSQANDPPSITI